MASCNLWNLFLEVWKLAQYIIFELGLSGTWVEFMQTVSLTKDVEMWWDFKDFISYS